MGKCYDQQALFQPVPAFLNTALVAVDTDGPALDLNRFDGVAEVVQNCGIATANSCAFYLQESASGTGGWSNVPVADYPCVNVPAQSGFVTVTPSVSAFTVYRCDMKKRKRFARIIARWGIPGSGFTSASFVLHAPVREQPAPLATGDSL